MQIDAQAGKCTTIRRTAVRETLLEPFEHQDGIKRGLNGALITLLVCDAVLVHLIRRPINPSVQ